MRTRFDEQMEQLQVELIKMGSLCEEAIALSAKALIENNTSTNTDQERLEAQKKENKEEQEKIGQKIPTNLQKIVNKISNLEEEIDTKEYEIETLCMRLLLQQQPVAGDLRNISAAMKMISDMERIGDQAADIAELTKYMKDGHSKSLVHIEDMAKATVNMVTDSVDAFVKNDLELARKVMRDDDQVDELFYKVKEELITLIYQKEIDAKASLNLLMAAKYFERIGDHAVNVAEWVEYSITGVWKKYDWK